MFPPEFRLSFDVGYDNLNYSEIHPYQASQSTVGFVQNSATFGVEFLYYVISHLESELGRYSGDLAFFADASYSALPISSSISGTSARVLRLNARLGVPVPVVHFPWSFVLMGGFYQTDMWVTNDAFGYQKLTGPELYPMVHWSSYSENAVLTDLSAFFKYSPLTDGTTPFSLSNREIAFGVAVRIPVGSKFEYLKQGWEQAFNAKLSYAQLQNTFEVVRNVNVSSRTFTFTVGYDW